MKRSGLICICFLISINILPNTLWANLPGSIDEARLTQNISHYYGPKIKELLSNEFKSYLHQVLSSYHLPKTNSFDEIHNSCPDNDKTLCYTHQKHSYKKARQYMFGQIYLQEDSQQQFFVQSLYCRRVFTNEDLPSSTPLGPMKIPASQVLNAEHVWPQSRFTKKFPKTFQKSDLHSLYPVQMKVNSLRGNHPFGDVVEVKQTGCDDAYLGYNKKRQLVFEPIDNIKGNVARSLFYFSVRYSISIDEQQEATLRRWHQLDPIDMAELERHEEIYAIQHTRNPFIDYPEWVNKIKNF